MPPAGPCRSGSGRMFPSLKIDGWAPGSPAQFSNGRKHLDPRKFRIFTTMSRVFVPVVNLWLRPRFPIDEPFFYVLAERPRCTMLIVCRGIEVAYKMQLRNVECK